MVMGYETTATSCGIMMLHDLRDKRDEELLEEIIRVHNRFSPRFIIFSDRANRRQPTPGERLAQYLKEIDVGHVQSSYPGKNPNTGSTIKVWIFHVDERKLNREERKLRAKEKENMHRVQQDTPLVELSNLSSLAPYQR